MTQQKSGRARTATLGACVLAAALIMPRIASAADGATPTFTKDVAPIFQ